jgi:EF-P beta-lysylation protein EpmB
MEKGNPQDPILKQVLPEIRELLMATGFTTDPVAESRHSPVPGLLQKYPGRALLITTGACGINCRYCFRRHFPYEAQEPSLEQALEWMKQHNDIHEVILSGGDPLTLSQRRLANLWQKLAAIPHLTRLRIHSREAIVNPDCITPDLVALLGQTRFHTTLVVHCNHATELNAEVAQALAPLRKAGVTLLNQSVLLAGINDSLDTLIALSETLFSCGILPYYLHQLDKVQGATHFLVSDEKAVDLHHGLRDNLSGYLVPKLVKELPDHLSKVDISTE